MKNKLFFTITVILFSNYCFSQNTVITDGGGDATTNYVMKWEDGATYKAKNGLLYDDGTYIGLGTTSPAVKFHLSGTDWNTSRMMLMRSSGGGWGGSFDFVALNSTGSAIGNDHSLGNIYFYGEYNGDANYGAGATIRAYTTEGWSSSAYGTKLEFLTTPNGSTTSKLRMTISQDGALQLNGSTSGYVGFKPAAAAGSTTYTLPSADGTSGQVLQTNGSATLSWLTPLTSLTGWNTTGNSGLTAGTNFVGTTDAVDLVFKVNSQKAGLIDNIGPTFLGYQAGNSNTATGSTGFGYKALYSNTSATANTAIGHQTLLSNTTGNSNTAVGNNVLKSNTSGDANTAVGDSASYNNTTGKLNTVLGYKSLYSNSTGEANTAIGTHALYLCTGAINTAIGYASLDSNTTGYANTACGSNSMRTNTVGNYNTAIGYYADVNGNNYSNATAIGNGAIVTASNYIRVGDANVTQIGGQVGWSTLSDDRFKFNVQENVKGLEFINKLRPVTYQLNTQTADDFVIQNMPDSIKLMHQEGMDFAPSTAIIHSGFIAQEVEQAAIESGFISSIVNRPANDTDPYSLVYSEIVVPLVKAVQEQQIIIDSLMQHLKTMDSLIIVLQTTQPQGASNKILQNNNEPVNASNISNIELANNAILYQNIPNPFSEGTVVKYFVPENCNAQIIFYDEFGRQFKIFNIEEKGMGQLNVSSSNLASGMYSYSLIINDRVVDTKKMIKL